MVWERRPYADEAPPPAPAGEGVDGYSGEFEDDDEAEISIHPLNNATVIITARNAQSQKNEWKERAVLNADGGLVLGTAAGWIVGRHDDRAGDKGGAGVTWSNGAHWRRVQSAPLQACGTPFPMVKES